MTLAITASSTLVKDATTFAKARAMIRPTPISTRLPLRMKFLKPVMGAPWTWPGGAEWVTTGRRLAVPDHTEVAARAGCCELVRAGLRHREDDQPAAERAGAGARGGVRDGEHRSVL